MVLLRTGMFISLKRCFSILYLFGRFPFCTVEIYVWFFESLTEVVTMQSTFCSNPTNVANRISERRCVKHISSFPSRSQFKTSFFSVQKNYIENLELMAVQGVGG